MSGLSDLQQIMTSPRVIVDTWGRTRTFKATPMERLQRRLKLAPSGCLEFQGFLNNRGYGQIGVGGKLVYAHRAMWIAHNGEISEGMCVCHHCDNPACCNIEHLFLGTLQDNSLDMVRKGRNKVFSGEDSQASSITFEECQEIRAAYAGGETIYSIARRYGRVRSRSWIGRIAQGLERIDS
jgi:hypothetical protein